MTPAGNGHAATCAPCPGNSLSYVGSGGIDSCASKLIYVTLDIVVFSHEKQQTIWISVFSKLSTYIMVDVVNQRILNPRAICYRFVYFLSRMSNWLLRDDTL